MEDNRKEALNKATKAKQKMAVEAEMMKQLQPTVPEVTAANIDMQPGINLNQLGKLCLKLKERRLMTRRKEKVERENSL